MSGKKLIGLPQIRTLQIPNTLKDYMLFNDGEEDWLLFIILFLCAISIKYLFFHSEGDEVICVCVYNIVKEGSTNFVYLNITVFPVVDWFCLFIYLWVLTFPLYDCSEFVNFVITLI
jgi:hypothetical protein